MPNQYLDVLLHTMRISGLSRVRTELDQPLIIPLVTPHPVLWSTGGWPSEKRTSTILRVSQELNTNRRLLAGVADIGRRFPAQCLPRLTGSRAAG